MSCLEDLNRAKTYYESIGAWGMVQNINEMIRIYKEALESDNK